MLLFTKMCYPLEQGHQSVLLDIYSDFLTDVLSISQDIISVQVEQRWGAAPLVTVAMYYCKKGTPAGTKVRK